MGGECQRQISGSIELKFCGKFDEFMKFDAVLNFFYQLENRTVWVISGKFLSAWLKIQKTFMKH